MEKFGKIAKKMNYTITALSLNSLLLHSWWNLSYSSGSKDAKHDRIEEFKVELRFLRTFLIYVQHWDGAGQLGALIHDIQAAFKESKRDFRAVSKKGIEGLIEHLESAIFKLQEKLMLWRSQIKSAYAFVESSSDSHSPLGNYDLWMSFCGSLEQNLQDLLGRKGKLPAVVTPKVEAVKVILVSRSYFLQGIKQLGLEKFKFQILLTHFGAVFFRTAHLSYLCWVDIHSLDKNMPILLIDLINKFMPKTPEVIEGCLDALMAFKPSKTAQNMDNLFLLQALPVYTNRPIMKWFEAQAYSVGFVFHFA